MNYYILYLRSDFDVAELITQTNTRDHEMIVFVFMITWLIRGNLKSVSFNFISSLKSTTIDVREKAELIKVN